MPDNDSNKGRVITKASTIRYNISDPQTDKATRVNS